MIGLVTEHMQAELIEIDENLCRSELTASQRSSYTKRRKVIWEALHPAPSQKFERVWDALPIEVRPQGEIEGLGVVEGPMTEAEEREETEVGEVFPPQFAGQLGGARPQTKSFAAETAAITGESKRGINQHLARAEALGDDIDRLVGTSLDKGGWGWTPWRQHFSNQRDAPGPAHHLPLADLLLPGAVADSKTTE